MTKERIATQLTVLDEGRLAALRGKAGVGEGTTGGWPNALTVNRSPLDKDDSPLPMGKFKLKVGDKFVFMDTVDTILITKGTQFRRWANAKTYIGCTMIEQPGKAEYKDSVGTVKLGKFTDAAETLTTEQKDFNKTVKFYFMILGLADISKAVDTKGVRIYEGNDPVWHPIKLDYVSKAAVTKQDDLRKLKKREEANFDFITHLTKPHRAGEAAGVPFYEYNFERGDNVTFTEDILLSIEAAQALIERENNRIYKLHLEAQNGSAIKDSEEDDEDLSSLDLGDE